MTPELDRYLTQPRRQRGAVVPVLPALSAEERDRAEYQRTVYQLQVATGIKDRRQAERIVNWSEFCRWLRDSRLLTEGGFTALVLAVVWRTWLGVGS